MCVEWLAELWVETEGWSGRRRNWRVFGMGSGRLDGSKGCDGKL